MLLQLNFHKNLSPYPFPLIDFLSPLTQSLVFTKALSFLKTSQLSLYFIIQKDHHILLHWISNTISFNQIHVSYYQVQIPHFLVPN